MDQKLETAKTRKRNLLVATTLFAAIAIGYGAYWALVLSHQEDTDDAYVGGHLVQVTPEVGGTVAKILVDDTVAVKPARCWSAMTTATPSWPSSAPATNSPKPCARPAS